MPMSWNAASVTSPRTDPGRAAMSRGYTSSTDSDTMPSSSPSKTPRSAACTPMKWSDGIPLPRFVKPVTTPAESTTTPPYLSGRGFGTSAIVTSAPLARCVSARRPSDTSVSVSPFTMSSVVPSSKSGSA